MRGLVVVVEVAMVRVYLLPGCCSARGRLLSGRRGALLYPAPLRTVHSAFTEHGSSLPSFVAIRGKTQAVIGPWQSSADGSTGVRVARCRRCVPVFPEPCLRRQ